MFDYVFCHHQIDVFIFYSFFVYFRFFFLQPLKLGLHCGIGTIKGKKVMKKCNNFCDWCCIQKIIRIPKHVLFPIPPKSQFHFYQHQIEQIQLDQGNWFQLLFPIVHKEMPKNPKEKNRIICRDAIIFSLFKKMTYACMYITLHSSLLE